MATKLEERVEKQIEAYEHKYKRRIRYDEKIWILLELSGKESVTIASKTKAFKLSDRAYEVRYDNVVIVTVSQRGITFHLTQNTPEGPIAKRMAEFFPYWDRPYGNVGNTSYQQAVYVNLSNKSSYRNHFGVNAWMPSPRPDGKYNVRWDVWKQRAALKEQNAQGYWAWKPNYGTLEFTWGELKEFYARLKKAVV